MKTIYTIFIVALLTVLCTQYGDAQPKPADGSMTNPYKTDSKEEQKALERKAYRKLLGMYGENVSNPYKTDWAKEQKALKVKARRMLRGSHGEKLNNREAHKIFVALAGKGDADAMLQAGMMYKQGMGCQKSEKEAYRYFRLAAEKGNGKAAFNLGLMWKYSDSLKVDLEASTKWFQKSAELGYKDAHYAVGYTYYKGIGIKQDYTKAVEHLQLAADNKHAPAMFLLGFCYLNGYGVERDAEKGKRLIKKTADMGYDRAIDFMATVKDPDNYTEASVHFDGTLRTPVRQDQRLERRVPVQHTVVENNIRPQRTTFTKGTEKDVASSYGDNEKIEGIWKGKRITYDWSGKKVVDEREVTLILNAREDKLYGIWSEIGHSAITLKAKLADSVWVFENMNLYMDKRDLGMQNGKFKWEKNEDGEFLIGNLQLYVHEIKEAAKPNMVALKKEINSASTATATGNEETPQNALSVYPNPFGDELKIELVLHAPCKLRTFIYSSTGIPVYSGAEKEYVAGKHTETIYPNLSQGGYLVIVSGDGLYFTTWAVKL
ncbi:MAG: sel1 repeat family protein [Prevotellaceae bacterium]|jgi:TPR repeat protein|nr:sel1 repeat family protein [Prevotellaceae bacterium]